MMVQDQSEATSNRIITAFTMMSARMNMEMMEKFPVSASVALAGLCWVPAGAARDWLSAWGPTGAAMGAWAQACDSTSGRTGVAARIKRAATMGLIMENLLAPTRCPG